jgi:hypothetical protein
LQFQLSILIMKQIQNILLLIAIVSFTAVACHKHGNDGDTTNPVLLITAPTLNASISGAVVIAGTVTDEKLHAISISITKDSDNSVQFTASQSIHNLTSYTIAETWAPAGISAETAVTLSIVVEDHVGNSVTQTVKFKVKP